MLNILKLKYAALLQIKTKVPSRLSASFSQLLHEQLQTLEILIRDNLLEPLDKKHHQTVAGKADIQTHISGRLQYFRHHYIPWIDSIKTIKGSSILEIGSGTGASTQALAEQGALVESIDVDAKTLEIARFRLQNTGRSASFHLLNADSLSQKFNGRQFDMVIFFAALEHMTTGERINALQQAFSLLKPGGQLFVLEAPNRLWLHDFHTAFLPFYHWLPDDLAIRYAHRSERKLFADAVHEGTSYTELARWGRGVSYHEFQLAQIPDAVLASATGVFDFHMKGKLFKKLLYKASLNYKYKKILRKMGPQFLANCFFEPFIDVCVKRKD